MKADQRMYDFHLGHWSNRKLSDIKKSDIQKLHFKIGSETLCCQPYPGPSQTMFNRAADWEFDKANPAKGIKSLKSNLGIVFCSKMNCLGSSMHCLKNRILLPETISLSAY